MTTQSLVSKILCFRDKLHECSTAPYISKPTLSVIAGADLGFSRGGGGADFQKKKFENFDDFF